MSRKVPFATKENTPKIVALNDRKQSRTLDRDLLKEACVANRRALEAWELEVQDERRALALAGDADGLAKLGDQRRNRVALVEETEQALEDVEKELADITLETQRILHEDRVTRWLEKSFAKQVALAIRATELQEEMGNVWRAMHATADEVRLSFPLWAVGQDGAHGYNAPHTVPGTLLTGDDIAQSWQCSLYRVAGTEPTATFDSNGNRIKLVPSIPGARPAHFPSGNGMSHDPSRSPTLKERALHAQTYFRKLLGREGSPE